MDTNAYTGHPDVLSMISDLKNLAAMQPEGQLRCSDVVDDQGFQYIDLVMEGGGTLGVALLGYIYILEQMNIRFLQLAGTSAGSIMSMLLAGGGPINEAKSEWLIREVAGKDFYDFVDGDEEVRDFVDTILDPDAKKRKVARTSARVLDDLKDHYGLNPGVNFHSWVTGLLQSKGVFTLADLKNLRRQTPAGLRHRITGAAFGPERFERTAVVTADLTTETKVLFPEMAPLYFADPDAVNPADFVRASMSVPIFFYPFSAKNIPNTPAAEQRWRQMANYHGPIPPHVLFVDGGIMSNFPIAVFHKTDGVPSAPTFGIRIGADRNSYNVDESFGAFFNAVLAP